MPLGSEYPLGQMRAQRLKRLKRRLLHRLNTPSSANTHAQPSKPTQSALTLTTTASISVYTSSTRVKPSTVTVATTNCLASRSLSLTPTSVGTLSLVTSNCLAHPSTLSCLASSNTALAVNLTPSPRSDAFGSATLTLKTLTLPTSKNPLSAVSPPPIPSFPVNPRHKSPTTSPTDLSPPSCVHPASNSFSRASNALLKLP